MFTEKFQFYNFCPVLKSENYKGISLLNTKKRDLRELNYYCHCYPSVEKASIHIDSKMKVKSNKDSIDSPVSSDPSSGLQWLILGPF